MEEKEAALTIPEFFQGKSVLITGATGFLGKVLVQKLVRSCPGIKQIYLLLRPRVKNDIELNVDARLALLLNTKIFKGMTEKELDMLTAVNGSIELDNLGLSEEDLQTVTSNVSVVFHCAANVRFDDTPSKTLKANLLGVKNVLDVCRLCSNLLAFVHTSTAYAYTNLPKTAEDVHPALVKPNQIIDILRWMNDEELRFILKRYDQGRQSFYQFSKALAENLIVEYQDVPSIIVRPSIVTASVKEPFEGWIDNHNGPSGFIVLCGMNIVKTLLVDPTVNADWVPVDVVANTLIVAAHYVAINGKLDAMRKLETTAGVPVINCVCPPENSLTWENMAHICLPYLYEFPPMHNYGKPGGTITSSKLKYALCRLTYHTVPAYVTDALIFIARGKPGMSTQYRTIHKVMNHLQHFTTHGYTFEWRNMPLLINQMNPGDAAEFPIDQRTLIWEDYIKNYVLGCRRYYREESDSTIPAARCRMMRIHCLNIAVKATAVTGLLLVLCAFRKRLPHLITMPKMLPKMPFLHIIEMFQRKFLR